MTTENSTVSSEKFVAIVKIALWSKYIGALSTMLVPFMTKRVVN